MAAVLQAVVGPVKDLIERKTFPMEWLGIVWVKQI